MKRIEHTETLELVDPDGNIVEVDKYTEFVHGEEGFSSLRLADGSGPVNYNKADDTFVTMEGVILRRQESS
jgi:hypothetical protein